MFATSDDLFVNDNPVLQCKTYRDMRDKLNKFYPDFTYNEGLIALLDEIRARFRLEPIGVCGDHSYPRIIIGTGYVPQAMVWYGSRNTSKGKTLYQYNLYSLNIEVSKGAEHTIRSSTSKGLSRRLTPEMFKLIDRDDSGFGNISANVFDCISFDEHNNYVPYMDEAVRLDTYNYFVGTEKAITPRIEAWVKEKSKLVEHNNKLLKRKKFIVDSFKARSVGIFSLPYRADYAYFFQEFENGNPIGVRTFFSDINELTDLYPHVVAANNFARMAGHKSLFDTGYAPPFKKEYNYIVAGAAMNTIDIRQLYAIFPASRIPSEDEVNETERDGGSVGSGENAVEIILDILKF